MLVLVPATLVLALATGAAPEPAPAGSPLVAVLPFSAAKGVDESLGATFEGALLGEVRKQRGAEIRMMAPDDVVQALPGPLRGRLKRCTTSICRAQMAQAVNADRALSGSISRVGNTVVLNLALLNAADGTQISQWTGRAPAESMDKLLDQLPQAAKDLFPPPVAPAQVATVAPAAKPGAAAAPARTVTPATTPAAPSAAAPAPAPGPAAPVAPAPGKSTPLPPAVPAPPPLSPEALAALGPEVTPVLPPDDGGLNAPGGPSTTALVAQTETGGGAGSARPPASPGRGWSGPLLGAAAAVGIPGVLLGGLAVVAAVGSEVLGTLSFYTATQINYELKHVPHKRNAASYDIDWLIRTGQTLQVLGYVGWAAGAGLVLLSVVALSVGIGGGTGLIVAAAPRRGDDKAVPAKKVAPVPPPPAEGGTR